MLIGTIKSDPKRIFLVDGAGALLSALMLGLVLTTFEPIFGMPAVALYPLAGIAAGLSLYSFLSYFLAGDHWSSLLKGVAVANLLYCCLTIGLVTFMISELKALGLLYFAGEIVVIVILATLEFKVARYRRR